MTSTDGQTPGTLQVTREETAKILRLSVNEVRRKEKLGAFRIVAKGAHNRVFYSRADIIEYAERNGIRAIAEIDEGFAPFSAEEAAKVFEELEKGATPLQCAMRTITHPSKIRGIMREYEALAGTIVLSAKVVASINELPLDGTFPITKAADVFALLESSAKGSPCALCAKHPRHLCKTCAIPFVRRQLQKEAEGDG